MENIDAQSWPGGPSPFCWLRLVVRLLKGWRMSMLEADQGALPFLSIAFGSKAIKGTGNIDAWSRLSPQLGWFWEYWHSKLIKSLIETIRRVLTLKLTVLNSDDSKNIDAQSWSSPRSRWLKYQHLKLTCTIWRILTLKSMLPLDDQHVDRWSYCTYSISPPRWCSRAI